MNYNSLQLFFFILPYVWNKCAFISSVRETKVVTTNHVMTALYTIKIIIWTSNKYMLQEQKKKKRIEGKTWKKVCIWKLTYLEIKILFMTFLRTQATVTTPVEIQLLLKETRFNFSKLNSDCWLAQRIGIW